MIKPFRLINASELQWLQQQLSLKLDEWNQQYGLLPLQLSLRPPPQSFCPTDMALLSDGETDLALLDSSHQLAFNHILFGQDDACFNEVTKQLILKLCDELLGIEQCQIQMTTALPHWLYAGSTCLLLELFHQQITITLLLNPDWVYQQLPSRQLMIDKIVPLADALDEEMLTLDLMLDPIHLSVEQLAQVQVGDLIVCEHLLASACNLKQANHLIAKADLCQSNKQKSILLRSPS